MKQLRNLIRSIVPQAILNRYREQKREQQRRELAHKKSSGNLIGKEQLVNDLQQMGIQAGDTLLVHSAMSKIGYLENGPETLIEALRTAIGPTGNLLMPTSPNASFQLEYAKSNPVFDVVNSPSRLGAITEYFRKLPNVKRSLHPTEPVAALGPDAKWLTGGHLGELSPYTSKSPFARIYEKQGKILYVGVSLDNAGTNLHTLEDAVDFKYPVYADELFAFTIIDEQGQTHAIKTKVHNPAFSKRRKCDELLPLFQREGVAQAVQLGEAKTWLFDAKKMFECMLKNYQEKGITMYTPHGEKIAGFD